jgi:hypothetical protein
MRCLLIQANGDNVRMGKYFKQPKYELYYKNRRIIEHIIEKGSAIFDKIYVAVRQGTPINFNSSGCEVIYCDVLEEMFGNSLAITHYKFDGMKYGFVEIDRKMRYLKGNEKQKIQGHITIGAYSVLTENFLDYLENATDESMLSYYNTQDNSTVVYSENHINLGDINSYIDNLWLL